MQLTSTLRTRLYGGTAAIVGVYLAVQIAHERWMWPTVVAGTLVAIALIYLQPVQLSTLLVGLGCVGYVVGNRGFAQLSALGRFPLFPAELVLLVAGGIMVVSSALRRELPIRRDALNVVLLVWMAISTFRLYFDARIFGVAAIRDYATVYYASFFFLAQWASQMPEQRLFLRRCLLFACAALGLVFPLYIRFPDVFLDWFVVRGTPLIFFKGDLAGTFMAVGAVLFFQHYEENRRWWAFAASVVLSALVVSTNNRASMLGLLVALGLLALAGRWRFAVTQTAVAMFAAVTILLVAQSRNQSWKQTPLFEMYERALSITDPQGKRTYSGEETFNKGDNNLFRTVWWQVCIHETVDQHPWLGLGWGYDLAEPFVRVYYPESGDDFVTRSPHNVLITIFARTGVTGLLPFLALIAVIGWRTWRAIRVAPSVAGLWCGCCVILASACLGVVLEGPMGAVVFWTLLGLANAELAAIAGKTPASEATITDSAAPHLPAAGRTDEVAATS